MCSAERRAAERVEVAFLLTFRFGSSPGRPPSLGTVTNLSSTGLFVRTPRFLEPPTRIAGVLRDDPEQSGDRGLRFVGEVAWRAPRDAGAGFGVRFVQMTLADHVALRRLVAAAREPRATADAGPRSAIHAHGARAPYGTSSTVQ